MQKFNIDNFINNYITKRNNSLMSEDLAINNITLVQKIENKNVLVIGGAGTIGSAYIKSLLKFKISKLVVIDFNENSLTELIRELRSTKEYFIPSEIYTYPLDFASPCFKKIFLKHGPFQIVANFGAHKHVRSEKDIYSIEALIENNVFKAKKLLDLLVLYPPEHFFCVSTDKAANPVNIMGASKKIMEDLIIAYSDILPVKTARFANVAFSNGSLPLGFLERINKNQPWSCPLEIKRYFVSPREAGEICLIASILGESGDIFFPKLSELDDMVSFETIVHSLLGEFGFVADLCSSENEALDKAKYLNDNSLSYPVYFFKSNTSGEKSFEEFYTNSEKLDLDSFFKLGVIKKSKMKNISQIENLLNEFKNLFENENLKKEDIVVLLKKYIPYFNHLETGKGLDSKM